MDADWGLRPVLFQIGTYKTESYPFFLGLGVMAGLTIYILGLRKEESKRANALYIVLFALVFGTIGAKLPLLFLYWDEINRDPTGLSFYLSGRTVVGGLIGGFVGTKLAKRLFGIKDRLGNQIAIPVAVAMAVGRIGCLLKGCCYGEVTGIRWGVDFGDGLLRHPTQIYEMVFDLLLAVYLFYRKRRVVAPGQLFRMFLNGYLGFRFFLEFIRVEPVVLWGMTAFQWLCLVSLIFMNGAKLSGRLRRKSALE